MYVGQYEFCKLYACTQVHTVCLCHTCAYVCMYIYVYGCGFSVHTCDHLHLALLQILENHFIGFHLVQKLPQHFHAYSNINTLIRTVILLCHHVQLKHVACESIEEHAEFYTNPSTCFLYP